MTDDLLSLAVKVRELSNRPFDEAGLERLRIRIRDLSPGDASAQRRTLRRLLDHHAGVMPKPNRDRP